MEKAMSAIDTISPADTNSRIERRKSKREGKILARFTALLSGLERRLEKRRSRRMLLELNDSQLKDIGVTRADAYREGIRSFLD